MFDKIHARPIGILLSAALVSNSVTIAGGRTSRSQRCAFATEALAPPDGEFHNSASVRNAQRVSFQIGKLVSFRDSGWQLESQQVLVHPLGWRFERDADIPGVGKIKAVEVIKNVGPRLAIIPENAVMACGYLAQQFDALLKRLNPTDVETDPVKDEQETTNEKIITPSTEELDPPKKESLQKVPVPLEKIAYAVPDTISGIHKSRDHATQWTLDPTSGELLSPQGALAGIRAHLDAHIPIEVTHDDEGLSEGFLTKWVPGSTDKVEAVFGGWTLPLSLSTDLNHLYVGHRTLETAVALLRAFRDQNPRRPLIDPEVARRLHLVRKELTPIDLEWLSEEMAAQHFSQDSALEWIFYLFYQRGRTWLMPEPLRQRILANLSQASLPDEWLMLFKYSLDPEPDLLKRQHPTQGRWDRFDLDAMYAYMRLVKESPEDVLFGSDVTDFLRLPYERLRGWVNYGLENDDSAGVHLLQEYGLLFNNWMAVLITTDVHRPPSKFERHVVRTFLRLMAGDKSWADLTTTDFLREFEYRGHRITIKELLLMLKPVNGWPVWQFILQRYGFVDSFSLQTLSDIAKALNNGALKHVRWGELHQSYPALIGLVIEALGQQVGRPGRGVLWLGQEHYYQIPLKDISSPDHPRALGGLGAWAGGQLKLLDGDAEKPKTVYFYLARLAGYEVQWEDVEIAIQNKWIKIIPYANLPERLIESMVVRLATLPNLRRPFIEMTPNQFKKIKLPGFDVYANTFCDFLVRFYGSWPPPIVTLKEWNSAARSKVAA